MNIELQNYLKIKFPLLYPSNFYFECEDGWFRIILWLSRFLQDYIDGQNSTAEKYPDKYKSVGQIVVLQIKEKFGTLRIYVDGGNEYTSAVINFAEYMSGFICETSGEFKNVGFNKKGWIKTSKFEFAKDSNDFTYVDDEELRKILDTLNL